MKKIQRLLCVLVTVSILAAICLPVTAEETLDDVMTTAEKTVENELTVNGATPWETAELLTADQVVDRTFLPNETKWFKIILKNPNETIKLRISSAQGRFTAILFEGAALERGEFNSRVSFSYEGEANKKNFKAKSPGTYYVLINENLGENHRMNLSYSVVPPDAYEYNDTCYSAVPIKADTPIEFTLTATTVRGREYAIDEDWFKLSTTKPGEVIKLRFDQGGKSFPLPLHFAIFDQSITQHYPLLGDSNILGGYDESDVQYVINTTHEVNIKLQAAGDYYIKVINREDFRSYCDAVNEEPITLSYSIVPQDANENNDVWENARLLKESNVTPFTLTAAHWQEGTLPSNVSRWDMREARRSDIDWFKIVVPTANETLNISINRYDSTTPEKVPHYYFYYESADGLKCLYEPNGWNTLGTKTFQLTEAGNYYIRAYGGASEDPMSISYSLASNFVPITGISLNAENLTLKTGRKQLLTASMIPANATNKEVVWHSSNAAVASVNMSGMVQAVAPGTVRITAATKGGAFSAYCDITVIENISVTGLILDKTEAAITAGETLQLVARIEPDGADATGLRWSASSGAVSVSETGLITGHSPGTATVTVRTEDGVHHATCQVSVKAAPIKGDVYKDGEVNSKDAICLAQYLARWSIDLAPEEVNAADILNDGEINSKDAIKLAQYLARWDVTLG